MHKITKLKESLLEELGEYSGKKGLNMDDLLTIKYLTSSIDHMCNIVKDAEEEEEYSRRSYRTSRRSYDDGMPERSYDDGESYGDGEGYEGGSSGARGRGRSYKRDSMGRYARDGYSGDEEIAKRMRKLALQSDDENISRELEKLAGKMSQN